MASLGDPEVSQVSQVRRLPKRLLVPRGPLSRFLIPQGESHREHGHAQYPWYQVLWLTGVDYFSTLGYQPGIAFLAAGALAPLATLVLVVVTLGGALPIYAQVARRSYVGQSSIAMLEGLLGGWAGKLFVLAMLGFASTDFVITMTLSAADAAEHAVKNPLLHPYLGDHQITRHLRAAAGAELLGWAATASAALGGRLPQGLHRGDRRRDRALRALSAAQPGAGRARPRAVLALDR